MPRKLTPEEAAVMIIRRRLQQREEAKMAHPDEDEREDSAVEQGDEPAKRSKRAVED